ncbi:RNA polymerase sigma factor [Paraburkholderia sp. DHOC27]|uniref:RNA polymerase sigma factor n=1 Tax=Paraburkholderia sp. DHOC27 TaxID=2303330 RepID=UPI000E3E5E99|nr:sigma-70 family RNA polymerase sigma factor [Paraburkholderia sp. DHOC27]RFU45097.1 sigma-70 family RNA polymerase sigma factor [Paraburkholderia sp. DHOC27]
MQDRDSLVACASDADTSGSRLDDEHVRLVALLGRVAQRDSTAFRELYRLTSSALFGLAVRITRKREWAEDVLQDSYIKIWRFAPSYDPARASAMTWMLSIVKNQALDLLRRSRQTDELPEAFDGGRVPDELEPEAMLQRNRDGRRVSAALQKLDALQRQAIALAYFQGQTHAEIADTLHVPTGTVKSRIRRGLHFLKALLESEALRQGAGCHSASR